jgi:Arc/MetJ family transcription regulator
MEEKPMRTTLTIDDDLLAKAQRVSGLKQTTALVREGLKALIERERARRLVLLGGAEAQLRRVPRRQSNRA